MRKNSENRQTETELPSRCGNCGSQLDSTEWHPTETVMRGKEVHEVLVFCDEACYEEWGSE